MGPEAALIFKGISAIGTIVSAVGSARATKANAAIDRQNAALARAQAAAQEERVRRESARKLSRQRALVGSSGVTFSGSVLDVIEDSAMNAERDALNVRLQGAQQSFNFLSQAAMKDAEAKSQKTAGFISAATTLTGAATDFKSSGGSFGFLSSKPTAQQLSGPF